MHNIHPRVLATAAALLAAAGVIGGAATSASAAADDVTWGVRAADNDLGSARQNFTYQAEPGEAVQDTIEVTNHGSGPLSLDVYAADGFTTTSGQLDVLTPDEQSQEVGAWTSVDTSTIQLGPGETEQVPFQLTVPDNATPGDYAGAIVTSLRTSRDSGVSVDRRLGIRIYLQVGGEVAPALEIDDVAVLYDAGLWPFVRPPATVEFTVRNTGNARLAARQTATVSGLFWSAVSTPADVPELLPGESWSTSLEVDGVVPVVYLTVGGELVPIRPDEQALDPVVTSVGVWAVPWLLIALVVLVAALVTVLIRVLRVRRRRAKQAEEQRIADAVDAALRERDDISHTPAG